MILKIKFAKYIRANTITCHFEKFKYQMAEITTTKITNTTESSIALKFLFKTLNI